MKVVQLIDSLKRGGGAETLVFNFARAAHAHNMNCVVITLRNNDIELCSELQNVGVEVREFTASRLIDPMRFIRLLRFLHKIKPDVIHTHLTGSTILGVAAGKLLKLPVVVTLHNEKIASKKHFYHGKLEAWLLRNWTRFVIAVGERTADAHMATVGNTPMQVIPNAVSKPEPLDAPHIQQLRDSIFPAYDGAIIATVGSLTEQKGYANLIQSLAKLKQPFKCMFIGQGPLLAELQALSHSVGVAEHIRFLGLRSDVHDLLGSSDIYVSSSLWEGLPMATLEAMYASLPIISTSVGDAQNILADDAGILVNAGDTDMLAQAIERLLDDKALRATLVENSFAKVHTHYNADAWMMKLKAVYSGVIV